MSNRDEEADTYGVAHSCRFYENVYPETDEVIAVYVKEVDELGATVQLLEYGSIEGMILASELSRRRIRSMSSVIRVGKIEFAVVLRVDKQKGFIDLSKRRVTPDDIKMCQERFNNAKLVHSILARVCSMTNSDLETLYESFGWDLYRRFTHAVDAFNIIAHGDSSILAKYNLSEEITNALVQVIKHRLTPRPTTIRSTIEVTCFSYEGIDGIKAALKAGKEVSTEQIPLKIRLLAPPKYVITTITSNQAEAVKLMESAISAINDVIVAKGGELIVKEAPVIVSDRDDIFKAEQRKRDEEEQDDEDEDDDDDEEE